jgi:hypothetical protein
MKTSIGSPKDDLMRYIKNHTDRAIITLLKRETVIIQVPPESINDLRRWLYFHIPARVNIKIKPLPSYRCRLKKIQFIDRSLSHGAA